MPGRIKSASMGYFHQPSTKGFRFSQPSQSFVSFNESFLRDIRGGMIIAQNVQRHGADRPLVTFYEHGKSLLFAIYDSVYQFSICSHVGTFPYRSASTIKSKFEV